MREVGLRLVSGYICLHASHRVKTVNHRKLDYSQPALVDSGPPRGLYLGRIHESYRRIECFRGRDLPSVSSLPEARFPPAIVSRSRKPARRLYRAKEFDHNPFHFSTNSPPTNRSAARRTTTRQREQPMVVPSLPSNDSAGQSVAMVPESVDRAGPFNISDVRLHSALPIFAHDIGLKAVACKLAADTRYHPNFTYQTIVLAGDIARAKEFLFGLRRTTIFSPRWNADDDNELWARRLQYYETTSPGVL
jgi:hypothetical protein